jgi:hypothetical protein
MRYVLAAAVALVVGIVVGGLNPRAEVRRLQAEAVQMKEKECRSLLGSEIARAIQRGQDPAAPPPEPQPEGEPAPPPPAQADPEQEQEDDLAEGRTILAARRAQARAALLEGADRSPEQLEGFDAAVTDMNAELRALGEDLLARVRELGETPPRSELYRYVADGLDVIIETDTRIRDALGEQAGEVDAESIDPLSHVDPALVDLLIQLDDAGLDP